MEAGSAEGNFSVVFSDLHPAVSHEFRDPDDTGIGKQFRGGRHGGFFRGS